MKRGERKYPERDAEIVRLRREGHTLRNIAADFGVSQERVRQIEAKQKRLGRGEMSARDRWYLDLTGSLPC